MCVYVTAIRTALCEIISLLTHDSGDAGEVKYISDGLMNNPLLNPKS